MLIGILIVAVELYLLAAQLFRQGPTLSLGLGVMVAALLVQILVIWKARHRDRGHIAYLVCFLVFVGFLFGFVINFGVPT